MKNQDRDPLYQIRLQKKESKEGEALFTAAVTLSTSKRPDYDPDQQ